MQCHHCGNLSPEDTNYCFDCGQHLGGENFELSAEGTAQAPRGKDPICELPERSWPMVVLLGVLTFGLYFPWWFHTRCTTFNRLSSPNRINPGFVWAVLLMSVTSSVTGGAAEIASIAPAIATSGNARLLGDLSGVLSLISTLFYWHQSLTLRRMLKQHAVASTGKKLDAGWFWTLLFGSIHLQFVISKLRQS